MVGHEAGRAHDHAGMTHRRRLEDRFLHRRTPPWVGGPTGALPRDAVALESERSGDEVRRLLQAGAVAARSITRARLAAQRPIQDDPGGQRVRREQDVRSRSLGLRHVLEGVRDPVGQEPHERGVRAVLADEGELRLASLVGHGREHPLDVGLHGHPRPVGSHHDADGPLDALLPHLRDGVRDERRRVLHPEERVERGPVLAQTGDQALGLHPRGVQQGEQVADRFVASAQVGQMLRRRRPAPADVRVVALDVLGSARGPVCHDQHPCRGRHGAVLSVSA